MLTKFSNKKEVHRVIHVMQNIEAKTIEKFHSTYL
jgi:hypothetical protein